MDSFSNPLQDAFNPPPRYLIESDSEDELGGGVYPSSTRKTSKAKEHVVQGDRVAGSDGGHVVVLVGGARSARAMIKGWSDSEKASGQLNVDGIAVSSFTKSASDISILCISNKLPTTTLYPLARWIMDTFKPIKLSILDIYPTPSYILPAGSPSSPSPPIRFLSTTTAPANLHPFSSPNLLSQTLSCSLLTLAAQENLPALLVLLPYPRIPHPPPRTLEKDDADDMGDQWMDEMTLRKALEAFGSGLELGPMTSGTKSSSTTSPAKASKKWVDDGGMYI